jgi:hypothetical protein
MTMEMWLGNCFKVSSIASLNLSASSGPLKRPHSGQAELRLTSAVPFAI